MNNKVKPGCLLIILFSITLVWTDNTFFSSTAIGSHHECADGSGHVDTSHAQGIEDQVLNTGIVHKSTKTDGLIHKVYVFKVSIKSNYFASIWQPPEHC
jgi:hypothetical protein